MRDTLIQAVYMFDQKVATLALDEAPLASGTALLGAPLFSCVQGLPTDPELSFPITAPYSTLRPYSLVIQFDAATTASGEHTIRSTD